MQEKYSQMWILQVPKQQNLWIVKIKLIFNIFNFIFYELQYTDFHTNKYWGVNTKTMLRFMKGVI